jgi:glyoxylase-like metal-dependent hydrolase (beta-lactamase superfamily II)
MPPLPAPETLSPRVFKWVEDDPFGQYPFFYVVTGDTHVAVIDTGTGSSGDVAEAVARVNPLNLPVIVVLTHIHFDHVGGAHFFAKLPATADICLSGSSRTFSQNVDVSSLAMAHSGASVAPFEVTRWLDDGDVIDLGGGITLEVLLTPGHTPDSCALYCEAENRLFTGDTIYPFTVVHIDSLGSDAAAFGKTIRRLLAFARECDARGEARRMGDSGDASQNASASSASASTTTPLAQQGSGAGPIESTLGRQQRIGTGGGSGGGGSGGGALDSAALASALAAAMSQAASGGASSQQQEDQPRPERLSPVHQDALASTREMLGLPSLDPGFDLAAMLAECDWDVPAATELFFEAGGDVSALAVRYPVPVGSVRQRKDAVVTRTPPPTPALFGSRPGKLVLSAGHVETSLPAVETLFGLSQGLDQIAAGHTAPSVVDGDYAEYQIGQLCIMVAMRDAAKLGDPAVQRRDNVGALPSASAVPALSLNSEDVENLSAMLGDSVPREQIAAVLQACGGNVEAAAAQLLS